MTAARFCRRPTGRWPSVRLTILAIVLGTTAVASIGSGSVATASGEGSSPFKFLGKVPGLAKADDNGTNQFFYVDSVHRRMYSAYSKPTDEYSVYLREYDLAPAVPTFLRERRVGSAEQMGASVLPGGGFVAYD